MKDLIIDFETIGNGSETDNFIVLDCSYVLFDLEETNNFEDVLQEVQQAKFDIDEQLEIGWIAETDTLAWWKTQNKETQAVLRPSVYDITLNDFVRQFRTYVNGNDTKIDRFWARGTDFDMPILKRIFRAENDSINDLIGFWKACDVRTYIKAKTNFEYINNGFIPETVDETKFVAHKSNHDVAMDVMRLQYIHKEL